MGVMAAPAGESFKLIVYSFGRLHFNAFEVILGKGLIVAMAVHTQHMLFKPRVQGMGVIIKFVVMAIRTAERLVGSSVEHVPVNHFIGSHAFHNGSSIGSILQGEFHFTVALQATLVVIHVVVNFMIKGLNFGCVCCLCRKGACNSKQESPEQEFSFLHRLKPNGDVKTKLEVL